MTLPTSDIVKEVFSETNNEISELQKQLTEVEQIMVQEWGSSFEKLDANITPQANIAASKFKSKFEQYITLNYVLVKLYENEIDRLQKMHVKDQISPAQKKEMLLEVKELENLCCLGLKSGTRTFCRKTLCRKTFCRTDILPTDVLPNGRFAERTFCRTDSLPNGQLAENKDIISSKCLGL